MGGSEEISTVNPSVLRRRDVSAEGQRSCFWEPSGEEMMMSRSPEALSWVVTVPLKVLGPDLGNEESCSEAGRIVSAAARWL